MARMRVEKVESSVKGGVVAQLGAKTLILGRNKRGKSAIVNSVELAGTGKASDVAGRDLLARDADLFMLAPPEAEKVWAQVRFKGGEGPLISSWELSKGHRAKRTGPEIAFPLRSVQEALLGSPETARKWILEQGGAFGWDEVLGLVPKSLHQRLGGVVGGGDITAIGPASALTAALEDARKRVREANARAKAARSLSAPTQPPPSPQDFTALEAVISAWKSIEAAGGESQWQGGTALEAIRAALEGARIRVQELILSAQELERRLAAFPPPGGSLEIRRAAVLTIEALVRAQASSCAICGGPTKPEELASRAARGRAKIEESIRIEEERSALTVAHRGLIADLAAARREHDRMVTEVQRAEAKAKEKKSTDTSPPDLSLEAAETKLRELHSLRAGWDSAKRSEEQALAAEREATEWDQLSTALAKALGTLVEKARQGFETKVQRFLPRSDLFGVELLDGEREVLRVGLKRLSGDHMVLHAALSGAEWATVTAALALATAPEDPSIPCVICPEERAFDPETLTEVLDAFDAALGGEAGNDLAPQLIVISPVAPAQVPAGWTVIMVGEKEGEKAAEAKVDLSPASKVKRKARGGKEREDPAEAPKAPARTLSTFVQKDGHLVEDEEERKKKLSSLFD